MKYSLPEIERTWLLDPAQTPALDGCEEVELHDKYLEASRLRLRAAYKQGAWSYKLGKKYGERAGYAESITNIYLTEAEHRLLDRLPGTCIVKRRVLLARGAVDVLPDPLGLVLFSVEFESQAEAETYVPPTFVAEEVTGRREYSGHDLAQALERARRA